MQCNRRAVGTQQAACRCELCLQASTGITDRCCACDQLLGARACAGVEQTFGVALEFDERFIECDPSRGLLAAFERRVKRGRPSIVLPAWSSPLGRQVAFLRPPARRFGSEADGTATGAGAGAMAAGFRPSPDCLASSERCAA